MLGTTFLEENHLACCRRIGGLEVTENEKILMKMPPSFFEIFQGKSSCRPQ